MKTIYIAGPMTGIVDFNYPEFHRVAKKLRSKGLIVENPAENKEPECKSWEGYMRLGIAQLIKCDAILLLANWAESKGAIVEHKLACDLGMKVIFSESEITN